MFGHVKVFLMSTALFALCDSFALVENFQKCSLKDPACLTKYMTDVINIASDSGIPDLEIPRLDPYMAKNIDAKLLEFIQLTLKDGKLEGLKGCVIKNMNVNIDARLTTFDIECNKLVIDGHYKVSTLPAFKAILADIDVHADGQASLLLEKVVLHMVWPFEVKKLNDGELHFLIKPEECTFTHELNGKFEFHGDNLFVGSVDISTVVSDIINENWKFIGKTFGQGVIEKVPLVYTTYADRFLRSVTVTQIFTDDLSPLVV